MQAAEADRPLTTHWVTKPDREGSTFQADVLRRMNTQWPGSVAIQACSTIPR